MLKGNELKGIDLNFEVNAFVCLFVFVLLFWGHKHSAQVHEAEFAEEQFWATPPDSTEGNHADCALLSRWAKACTPFEKSLRS